MGSPRRVECLDAACGMAASAEPRDQTELDLAELRCSDGHNGNAMVSERTELAANPVSEMERGTINATDRSATASSVRECRMANRPVQREVGRRCGHDNSNDPTAHGHEVGWLVGADLGECGWTRHRSGKRGHADGVDRVLARGQNVFLPTRNCGGRETQASKTDRPIAALTAPTSPPQTRSPCPAQSDPACRCRDRARSRSGSSVSHRRW